MLRVFWLHGLDLENGLCVDFPQQTCYVYRNEWMISSVLQAGHTWDWMHTNQCRLLCCLLTAVVVHIGQLVFTSPVFISKTSTHICCQQSWVTTNTPCDTGIIHLISHVSTSMYDNDLQPATINISYWQKTGLPYWSSWVWVLVMLLIFTWNLLYFANWSARVGLMVEGQYRVNRYGSS